MYCISFIIKISIDIGIVWGIQSNEIAEKDIKVGLQAEKIALERIEAKGKFCEKTREMWKNRENLENHENPIWR